MANFIAELTPNEEIKVSQDPSSIVREPPITPHPASAWDLYVDGSLNGEVSEANLIFSSHKPECLRIEYTLRLGFKVSKNEVEYEALLVGLR